MSEYDQNNIFAKILRGKIPCKKIYEDDFVLCFEDIAKAAPVHLLVIPKQSYICYEDFVQNAEPSLIAHFFKVVNNIIITPYVNIFGYIYCFRI